MPWLSYGSPAPLDAAEHANVVIVKNDPAEQHNVASTNPNVVQRLRTLFDQAVPREEVATEKASALLKGLEGYPAEDLRSALRDATKTIRMVTSNSDSPGSETERGTLRYWIESAKQADAEELTWIVFDPKVFPRHGSVAIELNEALMISSNTILDGRGARVTVCSRKDIHLFKLRDVKNVVIKNLIVHKVAPFAREKFNKGLVFPVEPRGGVSRERARQGIDRDAISVRGTSDNIWIDHCEFFLCGDETLGMAGAVGPGLTKVCVSWCEFSSQYYVALIGQTRSDYGADAQTRLSFHHNLITGAARRSPRVNRATAHVYNNYYRGWVDWATAANSSARVLIEGNLFEPAAGQSRIGIEIGTTNHPEGFVRVRNNLLRSGAVLDSYVPENVPEPTYARSVQDPDEDLKKRLLTGCGWQNVRVSFLQH
jgi:pectate lyase